MWWGGVEGYLRWGRGRMMESMQSSRCACMLGCMRVLAGDAGSACLGSGECQPLGCGFVLGLRSWVGGLQCFWAGNVGGVSVMGICGV